MRHQCLAQIDLLKYAVGSTATAVGLVILSFLFFPYTVFMMSSQAYAYEPEYSDTELSRIEEDSSVDGVDKYETERVSDEHRLDSSLWCLCSACEVMPTVIESQSLYVICHMFSL